MSLTLEAKSQAIWSDARISLGLLDGTRALTVNKTVSWDPLETVVDDAHLVVSASAETFFGSTQMILYMNAQEVTRKFWDLGGPYTARLDVTSILRNGANVFMVEYGKNPVINPSAQLTLTVILEIAFSGKEPDVSGDDWPSQIVDWLKKNPYAVVGIGMGVVGGVILYAKR